MMTKRILSVAAAAILLALGLCTAFAEEALPPYVYPYAEEDPMMAAIMEYLTSVDLGYAPQPGGVLVPAPILLKTELNGDETAATVYGNFWVFTYVLDGNVLKMTSGGENPGVLQLTRQGSAWNVVTADFAKEGSYREDIERFCGGDETLVQEYRTAGDGTDGYLPQYRRSFLIGYLESCGLDIVAYQDFGEEPVSLTD